MSWVCYGTPVVLNDCPRDISVHLIIFSVAWNVLHAVFRTSSENLSCWLTEWKVHLIHAWLCLRFQRGQTYLWVSAKQTPASVKAVNMRIALKQIMTLAQYWENGCIPDLHSAESFWITNLFSNTWHKSLCSLYILSCSRMFSAVNR